MSEKMLPANFTDEGYARFEADWLARQMGDPPPLWQDYLPAPDAPCTPDLIFMLLMVDIEFRIKAGLPALLAERYFEHPRLQQEDARLNAGQQMELIEWEYEQRWKHGQPAQRAEYAAAFPQHADSVRTLKPRTRCPKCQRILELEETYQSFVCPTCEKAEKLAAQPPSCIGRYRVEKVLGEGGFGLVYLAHDDQLQRPVAIKVPHRKLVARPEDAQAYLAEARTVARLDHPNIVPVYDTGSSEDFPCYVVSKFIDGMDLAARLRQSRLSIQEAVDLTATVAEALHHAHTHGLVHRDIKPGNILLDKGGKSFVADFGLALREQDVGKGPRYLGTPAYMSPEQAGGEGHRVDGRSDLFSLGIVLYELLTGRRPFTADSLEEIREQIMFREVRPPRQWDDTIPKELERICLKALSKRASERYTTAKDLADDLQHFLAAASVEEKSTLTGRPRQEPDAATPLPSHPTPTPSDDQLIKIVPKGLRSFDAQDAAFFLELLPGPRDREGLPDSVRFWKTRIEEMDADNTFAVGLIYGPSGCGKSSLVKAGLLTRLAKPVTAVYVEATGAETEARLLKGLRRQLPDLPGIMNLLSALAAVRRGQFLAPGRKLLLVLDQFEQWLHARRSEENAELVQALRQCDGGRLQAVVLVRDDFWLAVSRFMQALEIRIVEAENSRLVDLFDPRHAKKVLTAFGRAFGALPEGRLSKEQDAFLDQAVAELAQEGKVISVRLSLFAEMVKGKPWVPATLREIGGAQGVGVAFLEETFASSTAPPQHRLHQKAAQAVLKALLPETGADIKGHMRSHQELLDASGYTGRPRDFDELLRILDSELRLITPTDPEGQEDQSVSRDTQRSASAQYYQLTHDYLVPSLRDWLTRKQKETRRGRAELLLADRAAVWNARPENRQLPSLLQWLQVRCLTTKKKWTRPQRKMMRKAARLHALRAVMLAALLALIGWGAYEGHGRLQAHALRERLLDANINDVPAIVKDMAPYRGWLDPLLYDAYAQAENDQDRRKQLHSALALLPVDASRVNYLTDRLLDAEAGEVAVLRDALSPHQDQLRDKLWAVVETPDRGKEAQRLRAAAALAKYGPQSAKWSKCSAVVIGDLVRENPVFLLYWSEAFRPVKDALLGPLAGIFRDQRPEHAAERSLATNLLADYAADNPQMLADLLMDADDKQFGVLYPKLQDARDTGSKPLAAELDRQAQPRWKDAPLDPAWQTPDAALIAKIESAGGLVAARFALCQTMPLADFVAVAEKLRPCGFRPVRVRPYSVVTSGSLVATVWKRDGRDWQLIYGATADEVRRKDAEHRKKGYSAVDAAGYLDGKAERYAAVWVKTEGKEDVRLYVGVPEARHDAAWKLMRKDKLEPLTMQFLVGTDDKLRFSSIWRKGAPAGTSYWNDDEATFADRGLSDGLPADVSLIHSKQYIRDAQAELLAWLTGSPWMGLYLRSENPPLPHPERRYAGSFQASAALDHAWALGLTPAEQQQRCRELAKQDYRPAALAAAAMDGGVIVTASVWHRPVVPDADKERLAKRQANAAAALLRLGQTERVWPLLRHRPDPRVRSYLIHRLSPLGTDPRALVRRLETEPDLSIRRALLLSLGEFGSQQLPAAEREALIPGLLRLYREEPDAGLHGAAEWLLRRWKQDEKLREIDKTLAKRGIQPPEDGRRWYVNGQGQTFVLIPGPVEFVMGSPRTEADRESGAEGRVEMLHRRRFGRSFALAAKEVTVEQFLRFRAEHAYNKTYSPTPQHPVNAVSWYEAAAYCNWLSKEEGIPEDQWCYLPKAQGKFEEGMRMKPDWLNLTGYRLPTEAEWEFACRAGTVTSRYYGETEELLGAYAWYSKNSLDREMLPPGSRKPNDLGLFDLYGNALEWCQDGIFYYPRARHGEAIGDNEDQKDIRYNTDIKYILDRLSRVLRGGAFTVRSLIVRSARRGGDAPAIRINDVGFRPARTYY